MSNVHSFRFFRSGGLAQVRVESGSEIDALSKLDPKLWVALACPTQGLEVDSSTLALIDSDQDGRIRLPEILAAIAFSKEHLSSLDSLIGGSDGLALSMLSSGDGGTRLAASMRAVLKSAGKPETATVSVLETSGAAAAVLKEPFNGDGVITEASAPSPELAQAVRDIIGAVGGEADRSGAQGVSKAKLDAFFTELSVVADWYGRGGAETHALGAATADAASAMHAVKAKVDDYFTRCRLAAFDTRTLSSLNRTDADYAPLLSKDLSATADELRAFPLARVEANRALPLSSGLNPAWATAIETLRVKAVVPLLGTGRNELTETDWLALQSKLSSYGAWQAAKPTGKVSDLSIDRVQALRAGTVKSQLEALIERDKARDAEISGLRDLERLVRYRRDLHALLRNFANFADFYDGKKMAAFQAGTLFIDQRALSLCIRVGDAGKHVALAGLAKCYLAYCDCVRAGEKMTVVALVSDGDADDLLIGRNGYFVDRKGRDWDATITKIVENPISVREAFWSPYKRVLRYIEEQAAKRASAGDAAVSGKLNSAADTVTAPGAKPAEKPKFDLGSIALIGVAISGVAALVGAVLTALLGLGYWVPLGIVSLMLAVSLPSMVVAALKLRQRNLGPILDANGWAINGRAKINIPFGKSLTTMPSYPAPQGADAFSERSFPWRLVLTVCAVLYLAGGLWLENMTPMRQLRAHLGMEAPEAREQAGESK